MAALPTTEPPEEPPVAVELLESRSPDPGLPREPGPFRLGLSQLSVTSFAAPASTTEET